MSVLPTVETLSVKITELEKRLDERHRAQQAAVDKAAAQQNEWGRAFQDLKSNFVTTDRYNAAHDALVQRYDQGHRAVLDRQDDMLARLSRLEGSEQKAQFNITNLLALISSFIAIGIASFAALHR
jgi:iron-sulfur cluster repair protein YtfE (RIC family)